MLPANWVLNKAFFLILYDVKVIADTLFKLLFTVFIYDVLCTKWNVFKISKYDVQTCANDFRIVYMSDWLVDTIII